MISHKFRSAALFAAALVLAAIALPSCSRSGEGSLRLQANPILTGGLGWAVVKDAYVRLKEGPADSAKDLDHLRRGGVFRLDARQLGAQATGEREIWYALESEGAKGWVREGALDVYASKAQAEKAAAAYR
jgi:hypothetical protein